MPPTPKGLVEVQGLAVDMNVGQKKQEVGWRFGPALRAAVPDVIIRLLLHRGRSIHSFVTSLQRFVIEEVS